jgi:CO/xanthine dehydrogenase Mo-binding subunit
MSSHILAQNAAEAIDVDYEVLPALVDPLEAIKPGAPVVWPEASDARCARRMRMRRSGRSTPKSR